MQIPVKLLAGSRPELPPAAELPIFRGQVPAGERPHGLTRVLQSKPPTSVHAALSSLFLFHTPTAFNDYVALMNKCWAQDPTARPNFQDVITALRAVAV